MSGLEAFMNEAATLDVLVCMALIHHQFETIHPFYDGNGRTGRILNILILFKTSCWIRLFSIFLDISIKLRMIITFCFKMHEMRICPI